jgi:hypothetical protein
MQRFACNVEEPTQRLAFAQDVWDVYQEDLTVVDNRALLGKIRFTIISQRWTNV